MRVSDSKLKDWADESALLRADESGAGQQLLDLIEAVAARAEMLIDEGCAAGQAVGQALEEREAETQAFIPVSAQGRVLVCLLTFWEYSLELDGTMTPIERKVAAEQIVLMLNAMQIQARTDVSTDGELPSQD